MLLLLLLCLLGLSASAENLIRIALPDQATYKLAFSYDDNAVPANLKFFRKVQASGTLQIAKTESGYKLTIVFNQHYEAVEGMAAGSDLRGTSLIYLLTSDGKVTGVEGADEFLVRANADLQRQSDSAAAQARYKQLVYLRHNCDWIATALAGRPLERGLAWEQTVPAGGHPLALRPLPAKLQVLGPVKCGLGNCIEVEGTYQDNVTEEKSAVLQGVNIAWDVGRFRLQVHPKTGLVAKMSRYITSTVDAKKGPGGGAAKKRSIVTELSLTDETLPAPKPVRPTIIGSSQ